METADSVYYDGHCGLCHRGVLFVLRYDRSGCAFRFAPLQGETFLADVPAADRALLPDSMVVRTAQGKLLTRAAAWIHILRRLGGLWKLVAMLLSVCPLRLCDFVYDKIARVRRGLFRERQDLCPVVPPALRSRFDP